MCVLAAALITMPDVALAGANTAVGDMFCTVALWFTGNAGKGLATIMVTVVGIGALLGKIAWSVAILVGVNVAVVFGAEAVVDAIMAGSPLTACDSAIALTPASSFPMAIPPPFSPP